MVISQTIFWLGTSCQANTTVVSIFSSTSRQGSKWRLFPKMSNYSFNKCSKATKNLPSITNYPKSMDTLIITGRITTACLPVFTTDCKKEVKKMKDGYFPTSLSRVKTTEILFPRQVLKKWHNFANTIKHALSFLIGRRRYLSHSIIRLSGQKEGAKIKIQAGYFLIKKSSNVHLTSYSEDWYSITVFLHSLLKPLAGYIVLESHLRS